MRQISMTDPISACPFLFQSHAMRYRKAACLIPTYFEVRDQGQDAGISSADCTDQWLYGLWLLNVAEG